MFWNSWEFHKKWHIESDWPARSKCWARASQFSPGGHSQGLHFFFFFWGGMLCFFLHFPTKWTDVGGVGWFLLGGGAQFCKFETDVFFFVPMFFWVDWKLEKRFFWRMLGCFGLGVAEEYHRVPPNNTWSDCWHTNMNNQNMICLMLISGIHWMLNILLWPSSNYDTLWNRNSYYQLQLNGYSQQKPVDSL